MCPEYSVTYLSGRTSGTSGADRSCRKLLVLITVLLSSRRCLSAYLTTYKPLDRRKPVTGGEVCIPLYHRQALPSAQFLDRQQVYALHSETAGEGVAQVMEAEVLNLCVSQRCWNDLLRPTQIAVAFAIWKHQSRRVEAARSGRTYNPNTAVMHHMTEIELHFDRVAEDIPRTDSFKFHHRCFAAWPIERGKSEGVV